MSGRARYDIFVFEFATFSAVSGSVLQGAGVMEGTLRYDNVSFATSSVRYVAFEFATFSAVSRIPGAGVMEGTLR